VAAVLLESLSQQVVFVHRSHSFFALCHCSNDKRNPADVTY
jgi:hypothetical protein